MFFSGSLIDLASIKKANQNQSFFSWNIFSGCAGPPELHLRPSIHWHDMRLRLFVATSGGMHGILPQEIRISDLSAFARYVWVHDFSKSFGMGEAPEMNFLHWKPVSGNRTSAGSCAIRSPEVKSLIRAWALLRGRSFCSIIFSACVNRIRNIGCSCLAVSQRRFGRIAQHRFSRLCGKIHLNIIWKAVCYYAHLKFDAVCVSHGKQKETGGEKPSSWREFD